VAVRPDGALVVPAVWACVALLSNAVSMLPLETYRRTPSLSQRITDPDVVLTPSAGMTQSEWLHMLMVSLLLRGNAYGLKAQLDGQMRPTVVELLHPDKVDVRIDPESGAVKYLLGPQKLDVTARMWHVRGLTLPGTVVGLSPISYAAAAIGVDLSSRKFARDFFDGGGIPKATLTTDMDLTQEQAQTAKERLRSATVNREPAVFGNGVKYNAISVKPEESQFLATQRANISEIARFFSIPAEMIGGETGSSLTYSNVEQRSIDFLTYGVSFWLKRIEDAFSVLLPQPQFVKFNTQNLLRTDAETQAKVDAIRVASKVLPPSRILTAMDEPPLTQDEKEELELVPLTVTATGLPRATLKGSAPNVDVGKIVTPASDTGEPSPTSKPKLGVVNG
jgi:HK97 family phage portal protein